VGVITTCASSQPSESCIQAPTSRVLCACFTMVLPPAAQALCQTLMVFGMTVEDVLQSAEWAHTPRNLECVEIFAGVGPVAAAASELNLRAATYDKYRIRGSTETTEDVTTQQGFRTAVGLVMRLVPAALLWLAPVCSSWGFMNSSRCKRSASNGYVGDTSYGPVIEGNAMVEASVFLMLLAVSRGARAAMENPVHNHMFRFHIVVKVMVALAMTSAIAYRCAYTSAPYGLRYKKGYRIIATGKWIRGVAARCQCPSGVHWALAVRRVGVDGKVCITGIKKRLKESGAYPLSLGRKIIACATPGQPLQPSDFPGNDHSPPDRHIKHSTKKAIGKGLLRKTTTKHQARQAVSATHPPSRPSRVQRPASSVTAPAWLQPRATAITTAKPTKSSLHAPKPTWCTPAATSTPMQSSVEQHTYCDAIVVDSNG